MACSPRNRSRPDCPAPNMRTDSGVGFPAWACYHFTMAATTPTATRCGCARPRDCVDRRTGRYLTAVYWLAAGEDRSRVSTGAVSDRLGVTPATVTETFAELAAADLLDYEKHAGVRLTERGRAVAGELAYRQCVVRTFFAAELGVEFGADEGYQFGYVLPESGVETLRARVDHAPGDCCDTATDADCLCEARAN